MHQEHVMCLSLQRFQTTPGQLFSRLHPCAKLSKATSGRLTHICRKLTQETNKDISQNEGLFYSPNIRDSLINQMM